MNIQFMTEEKNGVITKDWYTGRPTVKYVPDFKEMIENACCAEEVMAISKCRELMQKRLFEGFAFEIVYTALKDEWDPFTGWTGRKTWQVYQHPWEQEYDGTHTKTKEEMIREIEEMLEAENR